MAAQGSGKVCAGDNLLQQPGSSEGSTTAQLLLAWLSCRKGRTEQPAAPAEVSLWLVLEGKELCISVYMCTSVYVYYPRVL